MTKNRSNCVEKIKIYEKSLYISYQNKIEDEFPNIWLRDHAKDDENWDQRSHQRKTYTANLDPKLFIKEASVSENGDHINILWSDSKSVIKYSTEFLQNNLIKKNNKNPNFFLWKNDESILTYVYIHIHKYCYDYNSYPPAVLHI